MTKPYRDSIENFMAHFRRQCEEIAEVQSQFHRTVLYTTALDPLARAAYGKAKPREHRANLVRLIVEHGGWAAAIRISLPQLTQTLRTKGRARFRLHRHAVQSLNAVPVGTKVPLAHSPQKNDLLPFAATDWERETLNLHTYANLFYDYRNNLVHEFREPGYGTDWSRKSTDPYYTNSAFSERELVFPVGFIEKLYQNTLESLESALLAEKRPPHSRFTFGSHWKAQ